MGKRRDGLVRLLCVVLAIMLGGCTNTVNSLATSSSESASATSSQSMATDKLEMLQTEKMPYTEDTLYTANTVETIPEMKELYLKTAVVCGVQNDFVFLELLNQYGLDNNYGGSIHFKYPNALYEYLFGVYERATREAPVFGTNPGFVLQEMAQYAFVPEVAAVVPKLFAYEFDEEANEYRIPTLPEFSQLDSFTVKWEDNAGRRTVTLKQPQGATYQFEYKKGEDGKYRLYAISVLETKENFGEADSTPEWANIITKVPPGQTIVGGIGQSIISLGRWNNAVMVTTLGWNDFAPVNDIVVEGNYYTHHLRGDRLWLLFTDRVVVLDETLKIVEEHALPDLLQEKIGREVVADEEEGVLVYFAGYDVSYDFRYYAYSYEDGLFLYDTQTASTKRIYKNGPYKYEMGMDVQYSPRFNKDGTKLYTYYPQYTGTYLKYFNLLDGTSGSFDIEDDRSFFDFMTPENAETEDYFGVYREGGPGSFSYVGAEYYFVYLMAEDGGGYVGRLSSGKNSAIEIPGFSEVMWIDLRDVVMLSDGRLIFSYGAYEDPQYYWTQPFAS